MATSRVAVTEGSGKNLATHSFSEDAVTKEVSRVNLNTSAGVETGVAASPLQVSLANHGANATAVKVDNSAVTQPISASSLPLPTGAATAAKQPALGTAGTASADVITVQGVASMTALIVDGSAVTQPVSLTSTAISGTVAVTQSGTWDEVGINDSGNSITIDNAQLSVVGTGTEATALRVTIASDSTGVLSVDDNGASLTIDNADITSIKTAVEIIDNAIAGTEMQVDVVAALPAGTNAIGKLAANSGVDIGDVDVTSISAGTNLIGDVSLQPRTTNGCDLFRSIDLDESEEEVKATAGNIFGYYFANTNASARYLKLYNATAANVTVGTTTPVATFYLPPVSAGHVGLPFPISFSTAISAAATTGVADADTGAPGANEVLFMAFYK